MRHAKTVSINTGFFIFVRHERLLGTASRDDIDKQLRLPYLSAVIVSCSGCEKPLLNLCWKQHWKSFLS